MHGKDGLGRKKGAGAAGDAVRLSAMCVELDLGRDESAISFVCVPVKVVCMVEEKGKEKSNVTKWGSE